MQRCLLLISNKPEDLVFASQVARVAELSFLHVSTVDEGVNLFKERSEISVFFIDASTQKEYEQLETVLHESVGLFSERIDPNMMHFLCSENINQAKYLIRSPIFGNFIFRNTGLLSEDAEYYGRIVRSTLIQKDHLRLVHLMNTGTKIQTIKIAQSDQKNKAVDAVKIFLVAAQFQTRVATIISAAVDELLLNAIFDAPTDTEGRPLHLRTNRSATLELDGKKSIEMHIGFDGLYVGVSIVDYFGSLDKENLLSHISKIYVAEEYKVQESVAGAGIGLATVFQSGGSLLFSVQPGVRTEVSVFFKKRNNFREFKKQFQFIAIQFY